jgi:hypothetical protein
MSSEAEGEVCLLFIKGFVSFDLPSCLHSLLRVLLVLLLLASVVRNLTHVSFCSIPPPPPGFRASVFRLLLLLSLPSCRYELTLCFRTG